jgi:formiminotetrahydrofolate cyclodeaminase
MDLRAIPFSDLLDRIAEKSPCPGGGAVVGAAAALAAALAHMAVNFSSGRRDLAGHQPALDAAALTLERARWMLLTLAEEDMQAYAALNDAMKRSKDHPDRSSTIAPAAASASEPPLAIIAACTDLLRLFAALVPKTNPHLRSDLAIAAVLAEASARASRWNVAANAPLLEPARAADLLRRADEMLGHAAGWLVEVERACASR